MAISGSGLCRCSLRCGKQMWSPTLLQRWDQRVRERPAVAAGFGAAQRDAGGEAEARRHLSYNAAISACEKTEQWQRALALLSEMWEAKLEPDVISFNAGISACEKARAGRASSGSGLWRCSARCGRRSWSPTSSSLHYHSGICACDNSGRAVQLLFLLNELVGHDVELRDTISSTFYNL
ncbi:unnamed protein product [Prorocentrum cordatum]|uniref:Pentatricopeptide repeat-containing protein n=1 Tax=Prorocentrum cordatum TaxID=2364126 RepID=A0ABN9XIU0_9DINO|nr:unnamed protein product [Polarella glacialis]